MPWATRTIADSVTPQIYRIRLGDLFMDGGMIKRAVVSRRWVVFTAGLGVIVSVGILWRYQLDLQAQQREAASERERRLVAMRAEAEAKAEAQRIQAERKAARVKSTERVGQLYREIDKLTHLGEEVQTSLQQQPRRLASGVEQSPKAP
jgi:hypothetical protein